MGQGIATTIARKKQTAKGTPASGSGAQYIRRATGMFTKAKDTYSSQEIRSDQQHSGDKHGIGRSSGTINGELSAGTYGTELASILRKDMAATAEITGLSLTIAGSGPFTITRGSGDFLTGGVKIGDVVRITAGTYTGIARDINLLVTGVTATVLTVIVPNGKALSAQGPVASSTLTVIGKKSWVPTSGHTNDWYTFEEGFTDLAVPKYHLWPDQKPVKADISLPPTGIATIALAFLGLGVRTKNGSAQFTSVTAETTTELLTAVNGLILIGGATYVTATGLNFSIDGQAQPGEAVIGSNYVTDVQKGDVKVSGQVTLLHEDEVVSDLFDSENATSIIALVTDNDDDDADFICFVIPRVKVFGDDRDDGKKQIVRTYPFTAEINGTGGAALASHQTTISIQDSQAA